MTAYKKKKYLEWRLFSQIHLELCHVHTLILKLSSVVYGSVWKNVCRGCLSNKIDSNSNHGIVQQLLAKTNLPQVWKPPLSPDHIIPNATWTPTKKKKNRVFGRNPRKCNEMHTSIWNVVQLIEAILNVNYV